MAFPTLFSFSKKKLIITGTLVILLGVFSGGIYFHQKITRVLFTNLSHQPFLLSSLFPSSTAQINLEGQDVTVNFKINKEDQTKLEQFSQNLGVGNEWTKGISLSLDEQTVLLLQTYLPSEVKLNIEPNKIVFSSQTKENSTFIDPQMLSTSSPSAEAQKIHMENLSDGYSVEITDPDQVLTQAVNTGQVKLSDKLTSQGLWQLLAKLDRIKLEVHGHDLSGEILLR